jgi:ABC-type cobalamin/Fe3+-siderophores transport system ATPase subunit
VADQTVVKVGDGLDIPEGGPVVILGPNGAGKTRHALKMLSLNDAEMIAALRNIALTENVPMQPLAQAQQILDHTHKRRRSRHWELSNEIDQLFSKLMGEDSASAVTFRDACLSGAEEVPKTTKLTILQSLWERLFPGRQISFAGYTPQVTSCIGIADASYPATQMSDGERVAVYLAARALDCSKPIMIVDEPEVHFHSRLGVRFWNEIEDMKPETRFVYVTHDLPFAMSRRDAQYVILKSESEPSLVELQAGIPRELAESLLAAASFSIHAQRVVFCEGEEGKSLDHDVYGAWFTGLDTTVFPVGNCRDVAETVTRFGNSKLVTGLEAIGIVDRDYWPDVYLDSLDSSVHALPCHEVESLLCLEGVFAPVATHLGKPETSYAEFMERARAKFEGGLLAYQVTERFKRRVENEFLVARNGLKACSSMEETREAIENALEPAHWQTSPGTLFDDEKGRVENALGGTNEDFLGILPGKVFLNEVQQVLGIGARDYVDLICQALRATDVPDNPLHGLGGEIEAALQKVLPSRKIPTEAQPS